MGALERNLELGLLPKGLESPNRDGGCKLGHAHSLCCQWANLRRDRDRFYLRL